MRWKTPCRGHANAMRSPFRSPRRWTSCSRQVSWLTGQGFRPAFPNPAGLVAKSNRNSPLTVAGAAQVLPSHQLASAPDSHLSVRTDDGANEPSNAIYSMLYSNFVNIVTSDRGKLMPLESRRGQRLRPIRRSGQGVFCQPIVSFHIDHPRIEFPSSLSRHCQRGQSIRRVQR